MSVFIAELKVRDIMNSYLPSVTTRSLKSLSIGKTRVDRMVIHPFSEARTRISCASHMLINRHLGQWALPSFRAQGGASLTELGVISVFFQHTKTSRNPPIYIQMIFLLGMRDFPLQKKCERLQEMLHFHGCLVFA